MAKMLPFYAEKLASVQSKGTVYTNIMRLVMESDYRWDHETKIATLSLDSNEFGDCEIGGFLCRKPSGAFTKGWNQSWGEDSKSFVWVQPLIGGAYPVTADVEGSYITLRFFNEVSDDRATIAIKYDIGTDLNKVAGLIRNRTKDENIFARMMTCAMLADAAIDLITTFK